MKEKKVKYIYPFSDFGFKKIFGEEASKPILIDFLNSLLPRDSRIKQLSFKNTERLPRAKDERKAVFDIYCENEKGEKFIVELQKAWQNYFKDRTIYYSTFPITEQVEKGGEWKKPLKAVYCIGILDFAFDDYGNEPGKNDVMHVVKLKDQHGSVFYGKLTYIYLEMPKFRKREGELKSQLDKWLYFIKNLEDFQDIPRIFRKEKVFKQAFDQAAMAKLTHEEWTSYQLSLKTHRDWHGTIEGAEILGERRGIEIGREEGRKREEALIEGMTKIRQESEIMAIAEKIEAKAEIATNALKRGIPVADISALTGFAPEDIEAPMSRF